MTGNRQLSLEEIKKLSSSYLDEGRKNDTWEITGIAIDNQRLIANIRMKSYGVSLTDKAGFHLSIFSTLEFISQLNVIYMHFWGGYTEKTLECWMTNVEIANKSTIRNPEQIQVEMHVQKIRRLQGKIFIQSHSRIFDEHGFFEVTIKGIAN